MSGLRMKAWQISGYNSIDGLSLGYVRVPPILRPGDVLVRVHAASVNPIDTNIISTYLLWSIFLTVQYYKCLDIAVHACLVFMLGHFAFTYMSLFITYGSSHPLF